MLPVSQVAQRVVTNQGLRVVSEQVGGETREQRRARLRQECAAVVNKLFADLQVIFPAWKQAWPTQEALDAAKLSWTLGFVAARLRSAEQIRYGVRQCRLHGGDFVPSVGKFISWCQPTPEVLGLPSVARAYLDACRLAHPAADRSSVHPAVYHAAMETGVYELANLSEQRSRPMFERNYALVMQMVANGEPLREVPKALPEKVNVRTEAVGRAALAALKSKLRGV